MSGMTVIVPQSLSVSASSEYGSFAADRLLTQNLGQVWQGNTYQETLSITAPAGASALAIFGTNALSIEVLSIHGYVGRTWGGISSGVDWANDRQWAPGGAVDVTVLDTYTYLGPDINNYWLEWDGVAALTTISLQLTAPQSARIYAGVASAGQRSNFPDPKYGLQETLKEYAIHHDNPLGSSYHRKINVAREFRWSLLVARDRQFYQMMSDIIYKFGSVPMAWRITNISGDSTDPDRMIWGSSFMQMPQGTHIDSSNSTIEGYLREFL